MFRYSIDEYIAAKQKEKADKVIEELQGKAKLVFSPEIDTFLNERQTTYSYLEDTSRVSKECNDRIIIVAIPRNNNYGGALFDLRQGFLLSGKSWKDTIPYTMHSFPDDYACPHGEEHRHVYLLFFTKYHEYEGSRDCILHYLNKLDKLKAFV